MRACARLRARGAWRAQFWTCSPRPRRPMHAANPQLFHRRATHHGCVPPSPLLPSSPSPRPGHSPTASARVHPPPLQSPFPPSPSLPNKLPRLSLASPTFNPLTSPPLFPPFLTHFRPCPHIILPNPSLYTPSAPHTSTPHIFLPSHPHPHSPPYSHPLPLRLMYSQQTPHAPQPASNAPNMTNRYMKGRLPEGVDFSSYPGRSSTPLPTAESKSAERINQLKIWNEAATNDDKRRLNPKSKGVSVSGSSSSTRRTDSFKDAKDRHSASFHAPPSPSTPTTSAPPTRAIRTGAGPIPVTNKEMFADRSESDSEDELHDSQGQPLAPNDHHHHHHHHVHQTDAHASSAPQSHSPAVAVTAPPPANHLPHTQPIHEEDNHPAAAAQHADNLAAPASAPPEQKDAKGGCCTIM